MKIVYLLNNLYDLGGIERITIAKANYLSEIDGNEVYVVVLNEIMPCRHHLCPKVQVRNLNIENNYIPHNRVGKYLNQITSNIKVWKSLKRELNEILPDIVVTTGEIGTYSLQWIKIKSSPIRIREFHFIRNYMDYQCHSTLSWVRNRLEYIYDELISFRGYDRLVILTEADRELNWKGNNKVIVMPNPITEITDYRSSCSNEIVMSAGRLNAEKNFSALINVWKKVHIKHPRWQLQIWGDGWLKRDIENQIVAENLQDTIKLMGRTDEMLKHMSQSSLYVMTSEFEGLPLVLLESISVGVPVISYDCPCGPRSIINDGFDGFLVPLHDEEALADKICYMIENDAVRKEMGKNGIQTANDYKPEVIIGKWMQLFTSLNKERNAK